MEGPLTSVHAAVLAVSAATLVLGCAAGAVPRPAEAPRPFAVGRDTFAFANESHFEYREDPATGARVWGPREPPPTFALRCAGVVRAARQLHVHARFDPRAAPVEPARYEELVRAVLARDPRRTLSDEAPIVIPGFADLHGFSAAHEAMVKDQLRHWREVMPRGDWKIVVPFLPSWQDRTATRLEAAVRGGTLALVRVIRFPRVTLNHALLLYGVDERDGEVVFRAYDPNDPRAATTLTFDRAGRTFRFPRRAYFDGGAVKVYEIYAGLLS